MISHLLKIILNAILILNELIKGFTTIIVHYLFNIRSRLYICMYRSMSTLFLKKTDCNSKYKENDRAEIYTGQFIYQSKSSSRQGHIRRLGFFLSVLKQKFSKFYLLFTIHLLSETCCQIWQPSGLWSSAVSRNATSISSMAKIVPIITWIWPLKGKCFGNFTLVQKRLYSTASETYCSLSAFNSNHLRASVSYNALSRIESIIT